ncbi:uncharacterized protein M421DRAFT_269037 [Didymella exigua CBS 183.55]|uniref:Uncharacterized protein n=1 Tax=Didymella exigua CBS 183.55 TaxID=1150837 RepID=A0A6A5RB88_9PLEO|nr:uncharacterized protein M421DRAFT_269037 [Didymella exigua CBS 183.55]KAF1924912.1 hypothetical protein M421DRAFT_269037 [Didymella exigua CBS 183.55]
MRRFPAYIDLLRKQWIVLYMKPEPATKEHWVRHMEYLKCVVPDDRLIFYDVKEGWEPLCRVLEKAVPDMEFPRIDDERAIEELARRFLIKGFVRWGVVTSAVRVGVVVILWVARTYAQELCASGIYVR